MNNVQILLAIFICSIIKQIATKPQHGSRYEYESRTFKKKQRPCVNFPKNQKGRTLFDWNFQYVDVSYNYNYFVNCPGNSNTGGQGSHGGHGGGTKPHPVVGALVGGLLGNNPQGGSPTIPVGNFQQPNRPLLSGLLTQVQTQTQNLVSNAQGIGSALPTLPPNGIFNGNGENFLSNIFGNLFNNGGGSSSSSSSSSSSTSGNPSGGSSPPNVPSTTIDPGDVIYNDEKPVHEDFDDVPQNYNNLRPGQYFVASNPIFGTFVQDVSGFHPIKDLGDIFKEAISFFFE